MAGAFLSTGFSTGTGSFFSGFMIKKVTRADTMTSAIAISKKLLFFMMFLLCLIIFWRCINGHGAYERMLYDGNVSDKEALISHHIAS
jgi:hypothetical protein